MTSHVLALVEAVTGHTATQSVVLQRSLFPAKGKDWLNLQLLVKKQSRAR